MCLNTNFIFEENSIFTENTIFIHSIILYTRVYTNPLTGVEKLFAR